MPLIGKRLSKTSQVRPEKQEVVGFVVRSKPTLRVIYYETREVPHLSNTDVLLAAVERRRQLLSQYPKSKFSIDAGVFRTPASFFQFLASFELGSSYPDSLTNSGSQSSMSNRRV